MTWRDLQWAWHWYNLHFDIADMADRKIGNIFCISRFFLPGCCVWTNSWPIEVAHKPILYQMFPSSDGRRVIIGKPVLHFPSLLLLLFLPTTSWISHNLGTFVFSTSTLKTEIKSIPACHYLLPKQSPCGDHWIEYFPASNCRKLKIEFCSHNLVSGGHGHKG